ncbi:hypothetical protein M9435_003378 [Picochlorum sp. BPE23]|nr:hypothetical protein M9435_003378 [Picochlorum sp. BPE23]|mmetsp:Transcript_8495/g.17012  ORF Transcript_8495/g.17012 Transcript_8495/m.17012 type:complete len:85 (+) Transcript_8495:211-465(+)
MNFFLDYIRQKIEASMQSSEDRRREWEENLNRETARAQTTARYLSLPTKPWGFWKDEKLSAKYETNADPAVSKLPGRSTPDVLS